MDPERPGISSASHSIRYLCHGQVNLERALRAKGLIVEGPNKPAESGTRIHAARAGENVELDYNEANLEQTLKEMEFAVSVQLDEIDTVGFSREMRFYLREGLRPIFSGQADWIRATPDLKHVIIGDHKSGRLEVSPAERNYQLRDLAALWHNEHDETEVIHVVICQPLISHTPSIARYSREDARRALEDLRANLIQVSDPDAPRTPGAHCKYCPARIHCEEAKTYAFSSPNQLIKKIESGEITLPVGKDGAAMLDKIEVASSVVDKLWEMYKAIVTEDPYAIEGWTISEGGATRRILDIKRARELLASQVPDNEIDECLTLSVAELEKRFCNHAGKIQKKAKAEFNALLEPVIEMRPKRGSLIRVPARGKKAQPQLTSSENANS